MLDILGRTIAFCGDSKAGKDAALSALRTAGHNPFGGWWVQIRFADPIKRAVAAALEIEEQAVEKYKESPITEVRGEPTIRDILKVWGCSARDQISPHIWADMFRADAEEMLRAQQKVVVVATDLRFPEEVEAVRSLGGWVVRIDRQSNTDGSQFAPDRSHASEQGVPDELVDERILNKGINLRDFEKRVVSTIIPLLHRGARR